MKGFIPFLSLLAIQSTLGLSAAENNKYYILSIKDSSKYSFNIQFGEVENVKVRRRDLENELKFTPIAYEEIKDMVRSEDCYSELNDKEIDDTTFCDLKKKDANLLEKGELNIVELEKQLKPEEQFVKKEFSTLAELILDHMDSYKNDDKLTDEIKTLVHKRDNTQLEDIINNKAFEKILKKFYNILDVTVFRAYLSDELYKIIKNLPDVVSISEDRETPIPEKGTLLDSIQIMNGDDDNIKKNFTKRDNETTFYDLDDIKADTHWESVSVEENAPNHLSLISQSKFDKNIVGQYDSNFYYPSVAGKGVDIYIIDTGLYLSHADFDTTERTVTCDIIFADEVIEIDENSIYYKHCYPPNNMNEEYHGTFVASAAAGTIYGVAKKANVHMIAFDGRISNKLLGFNYIKEHAKDPHKAIINISSGGYFYTEEQEKIINVLVEMGFMIIAAAGNNAVDSCITDERTLKYGEGTVKEKAYPVAFENVIGVGAINDYFYQPEKNDFYDVGLYSNFGDCIDFYAPGYTKLAYHQHNKDDVNEISNVSASIAGTSFSAPIVSGIAAVLISEHPEITFDFHVLKKMLSDLSVKGIIRNAEELNTANRYINNGKKVVYSSNNEYKGCGILSGKRSCSDNQCCNAEGYCGIDENFCGVDCQSEFGVCQLPSDNENQPTTVKATTTVESTPNSNENATPAPESTPNSNENATPAPESTPVPPNTTISATTSKASIKKTKSKNPNIVVFKKTTKVVKTKKRTVKHVKTSKDKVVKTKKYTVVNIKEY